MLGPSRGDSDSHAVALAQQVRPSPTRRATENRRIDAGLTVPRLFGTQTPGTGDRAPTLRTTAPYGRASTMPAGWILPDLATAGGRDKDVENVPDENVLGPANVTLRRRSPATGERAIEQLAGDIVPKALSDGANLSSATSTPHYLRPDTRNGSQRTVLRETAQQCGRSHETKCCGHKHPEKAEPGIRAFADRTARPEPKTQGRKHSRETPAKLAGRKRLSVRRLETTQNLNRPPLDVKASFLRKVCRRLRLRRPAGGGKVDATDIAGLPAGDRKVALIGRIGVFGKTSRRPSTDTGSESP